MIYLDSAATTEVDKRLKPLIDKYLFDHYGNAGSPHKFGNVCKTAISEARRKIAESVNVVEDGVIFTSGGSEANTLAIIGLANHLKRVGRRHIVTSKYEHHSVLNAMQEMERQGFEVTYLDVPNGKINYGDLIKAIGQDTGFVSIMFVNNELGSVNDIEKIYAFCQERSILFHSDCVQAVGMKNIDMSKMADFVSISGHKIHAPKGIGCLCAKDKDLLSNIIYGGEQEYGLRPGTENVPSIVAFGEMMHQTALHHDEIVAKLYQVSTCFEGELIRVCRENDIQVFFNAPNKSNSPKVCSVRFEGVDAETLVMMLSLRGVYTSAGSACSSHSVTPSHVLKAIGLSDEDARSTIRVSFSDFNTEDEVVQAARIIADCVSELRSMQI